MKNEDVITDIESGLITLHRAFFQHKGWEQLKQEAGVELDRPEAALLKTLAMCETGSCRVQQVASYLGIEAPSVSRTAQQLEQAGLVSKHPDAEDGRASNLKLTAKGRRQLDKLLKVRRARLQQLVAGWSTEDKRRLAELLTKLSV